MKYLFLETHIVVIVKHQQTDGKRLTSWSLYVDLLKSPCASFCVTESDTYFDKLRKIAEAF